MILLYNCIFLYLVILKSFMICVVSNNDNVLLGQMFYLFTHVTGICLNSNCSSLIALLFFDCTAFHWLHCFSLIALLFIGCTALHGQHCSHLLNCSLFITPLTFFALVVLDCTALHCQICQGIHKKSCLKYFRCSSFCTTILNLLYYYHQIFEKKTK